MHSCDARAIANEFIARARRDGLALTNMQLQKLPYIAHGWSWALLNERLIKELPQAWPYGPVYPSLYHSLRHYGARGITDFIRDENGRRLRWEPTPQQEALLEAVWNIYRTYTAWQLSNMTHQPDTPWTAARQQGDEFPISDELTKTYYQKLLKDKAGAPSP